MRTTPVLAAALLTACATSLPAPNAPAAPATVEVTATGIPGQAAAERSLKLITTITSVDKANRTITIKGAEGHSETVTVPPEMKRFDELAAWDAIEIEIRQGLLLEYQPAGSAVVARREVAVGGWSGLSDPPAGATASGQQATVQVAAIDLKARLVTLQGPAGNQYQVKAGPKLAIEKLKVGDQVLATYVNAVALQIVKAGVKL